MTKTEQQVAAMIQAKLQNLKQKQGVKKGKTLDPSFMFVRNSCWPKDKR